MNNALKYDSSLEDTTTFYDKLPYVRNLSVCGADSVRMYSGNVIKSFAVNYAEEKEIPNHEEALLANLRREEELKRLAEEAEKSEHIAEEESSANE